VAHVAVEAGVALRIVENESAPIVVANSGGVRQVLLNILLNAVQASHAGGEVRIGWQSGPTARVRIEDDGIGMTPEVREQVFEPFYTQQPSGTGLGLFVSLNLVRQWGGDILVTSAPGHGSTFEVVFPPAEGACRTIES
jgi:signal transduction histidine kinase